MENDFAQLQLRDIHLPEPISWWPLAPGWWILLVLIAALILFLIVFRKIKARRKIKRQGYAALETLKSHYLKNQDGALFIKNLSILLRKLSVNTFPRKQVASLTGQEWLQFLDSVLEQDNSKSIDRFSSKTGRVLIVGPYERKFELKELDVDGLEALAKSWIRSLPTKLIESVHHA